MSRYFRAVEIDEDGNTTEGVSYVGVHPIARHRHPDEPQIAFVETDVVDALLKACEAVQIWFDAHDEYPDPDAEDYPHIAMIGVETTARYLVRTAIAKAKEMM